MARSPAKAPKRKRAAVDAAVPDVDTASVAAAAVTNSAVAAEPAVAEPVTTSSSETPAVTLVANCSIKEVAALRTRLCAVVDASGPVAIDASAVERIDTATLQLLYAFVRDRLNSDREVTWQGVTAALTDAARLLGVRDPLCLPAAAR